MFKSLSFLDVINQACIFLAAIFSGIAAFFALNRQPMILFGQNGSFVICNSNRSGIILIEKAINATHLDEFVLQIGSDNYYIYREPLLIGRRIKPNEELPMRLTADWQIPTRLKLRRANWNIFSGVGVFNLMIKNSKPGKPPKK